MKNADRCLFVVVVNHCKSNIRATVAGVFLVPSIRAYPKNRPISHEYVFVKLIQNLEDYQCFLLQSQIHKITTTHINIAYSN